MSKNKRAPKGFNKYVVVQREKGKTPAWARETYRYCNTQKEAREWARGMAGKLLLFAIAYDFIEELK